MNRAGVSALGGIAEQPSLPAYSKGADGVFGTGVADVQASVFAVANQFRPLVQGVIDGFVGEAAFDHSAEVICKPSFEVIE